MLNTKAANLSFESKGLFRELLINTAKLENQIILATSKRAGRQKGGERTEM